MWESLECGTWSSDEFDMDAECAYQDPCKRSGRRSPSQSFKQDLVEEKDRTTLETSDQD
jgi:hypothetical protein